MHFTPLLVVLSSLLAINASPVPGNGVALTPRKLSNVAYYAGLEERYTPVLSRNKKDKKLSPSEVLAAQAVS